MKSVIAMLLSAVNYHKLESAIITGIDRKEKKRLCLMYTWWIEEVAHCIPVCILASRVSMEHLRF